MEFSDAYDFEEFAAYLSGKGLHDDVVSVVLGNRINGELFLSLTEGDLKELVPAIGDRLCLRKVLEEARKVNALTCLVAISLLRRFTRAKLLKICVRNHSKKVVHQ